MSYPLRPSIELRTSVGISHWLTPSYSAGRLLRVVPRTNRGWGSLRTPELPSSLVVLGSRTSTAEGKFRKDPPLPL